MNWIYSIAERLSLFFEAHGFYAFPALRQFRRDTGDGFQCVILSISDYEDMSLAELHLGLRRDKVEQTAFPFTNGLPGFQPNSTTLITPLGKVMDQHPMRFRLRDEADLEDMTIQCQEYIAQSGLPFLKRYDDLHALNVLFNTSPEKPCPWVHNQFHPAFRGLTVGALLARDDLTVLVEQHRAALHRLGAYGRVLENYDRLARYLLHYLRPN